MVFVLKQGTQTINVTQSSQVYGGYDLHKKSTQTVSTHHLKSKINDLYKVWPQDSPCNQCKVLGTTTRRGLFFLLCLSAYRNLTHWGRDKMVAIFQCIFLNENVSISLKILLKFVPKIRTNNIPALVQIMAWHRPGDKPLSEPMMISSLTHICVTRPQWVKLNFEK